MNFLENEIKKCELRKEYCKLTYPDYVDDEYNCAEMKFIFGIKAKEDGSESAPSFCTLNDFVVYYNRETRTYYADVDLLDIKDATERLSNVIITLKKYINDKNIKIDYNKIYENPNLIMLESNCFEDVIVYSYIILNGLMGV